jgi:glycosyltransferase involved in cell wall biosynthesis
MGDSRVEQRIAGHSKLYPEHQARLERLAADRGVADRLVFLGEQTHAQVLAQFRGAVAMAFPSFIESFGHPLLEALAAGTPLVASDIPTCREIGDGAALYFPPSDPVALARAVDAVQADPDATRERVELGLARAREFSWKRTFDRLCEVFDEVLGPQ